MTQVLANTPKGFETSRYPVTRLYSVASSLVRKIGPGDLDDREVLHYSIPNVQEYGTGMVEDGGEIESDKWVLEDECVLISKLNPRKATVCLAVPSSSLLTVASTEFIPLATGSKTDNRFLNYLLQTPIVTDHLTARTESATRSHQRVNPRLVTSLVGPWPDSRTRQQVVEYLDRETAEIDAFLHDQNLLIELLHERRLAQLARDVAGSDSVLAKHDVPWAPGLKTSFPTVNIRRVAEMRTGHTPNRNKPEYWLETHIPWFTLADVWQLRAGNKFLGETTEMISSLGLANSAADLLPAGTVVLSRTASVGFTGIMPRPMATSQDYWNWVCGPEILPEYLWFQFRAMRPEFDRIKSGSTHKTIYKADAAAITLVLPPLEDQHTIVQRLTAVDEELAAAEEDVLASIQLAQERRSALISAAVTGQIDVTTQGVPAAVQLRDELEVHV